MVPRVGDSTGYAPALSVRRVRTSSRRVRLFGMETQLNDLLSTGSMACVSPHPFGVTTMLDTLPYADLLAIYNALAEKPVGRFDTRANGVRRTAVLMEERGLTLPEAAQLANVPLPDGDAVWEPPPSSDAGDM